VVQANDDFKKDVRAELSDLHRLLTRQQNSSSPSSNIMSTTASSPITSPVHLTSIPLSSGSSSIINSHVSPSSIGSPSIADTQTQMMMMMMMM
jgi:hypothetical protein